MRSIYSRAVGRTGLAAVVLLGWAVALSGGAMPASAAATPIIGEGSSFAGPEVSQWVSDVGQSPYNLPVSYTSSSSGDGRFAFANQTVDFGVTDIPFQPYPFDTKSPTFAFDYIPVTAGGLAFMYHINGLSTTLQLSSYSACAIMTGGVAYWDDPIIKADNPGVSLPHIAVHPVTRSDLAGTNFVLQEYCIHEQPNLWAAFVNSPTIRGLQGQVSDLSATAPRSDWPLFPTAIPVSGSTTAAQTVADPDNDGYITAVETAYAIEDHTPVASVKNASGIYTQPSALDVASALAYATQQPDGVHVLNFDGAGPHVYNPSTYSYLLTPTTGWNSSKGATLSAFVNYALTLGQQKAPEIGYASLGLSLEQYGVNTVQAAVPGAVAPTADEKSAYACGDFTPTEVQAGATAPTCGTTNPNNSAQPGGSATTGAGGATTAPASGSSSAAGTTATSKSAGTSGAASSSKGVVVAAGGLATTSGSAGSSGSGSGSGVDPGVTLAGASTPLASTGINPLPVVGIGVLLLSVGWVGRRRLARIRIGGRPR
jgi:ABC-type phosphate transport system substrate-binding protein